MIDHLPRLERIWLLLGTGSLVVFLIILGVMACGLGLNPPGHMHTIVPEQVKTTAPFDKPALTQIGPNEYKASMIAEAFAFTPGEIAIPRGAKVHFEITSPDVVHGLLIPNTNVNIMVVPGHVTEFEYTFKKSGDYAMLCHEYCGIGHHMMMGKLVVQ
ncbi:cytochrome c oxidase subunit II [Paenibacillus montanisoli]|uniref:Cytochrome aa3 subunit 2 n=1 Tax=Paenibacillus montanisoli TaxID=2081970 RepID=A0A328U921_9BACL|nr:cytochrome c oxidase subunit II [Paenibacillus montanisoli]RAP76546.1 cytochrome C oxidase subunit II [Paenibacillus montanisoli]